MGMMVPFTNVLVSRTTKDIWVNAVLYRYVIVLTLWHPIYVIAVWKIKEVFCTSSSAAEMLCFVHRSPNLSVCCCLSSTVGWTVLL